MTTVIDGTTGSSIAGAGTVVGNLAVGGNLTVTGTITGSGAVLQVVNSSTGAVATGTTQIPSDDTIPQLLHLARLFRSLVHSIVHVHIHNTHDGQCDD